MTSTPRTLSKPAPLLYSLPRPLLVFVWSSIALTLAAFLFSLIARHMGYGLPYSNAYYYSPGDRFGDFSGFRQKFKDFGTPTFFTTKEGFFMYPAPMVFVFGAFFIKINAAAKLFMAFLFAANAFLITAFTVILRRAGLRGLALTLFVSATVLLSYPTLFNLMRWNIEILIFLLTACGIWTYWRDRFYAAAFFFAVAASLKFFPFIFFGLLFAQKRYKETAFGVVTAIAITLLSLATLGPSIPQALAWDNLQMATFRELYAGLPNALGYDHSMFAFLKWIMLPWSHNLTTWVTPYTRSIALGGLVLYFARIWRMPRLNQVLAISILAVTLAPTSYDYTLLSLYPAFLLLCLRVVEQARLTGQDSSQWNRYFFLFAVILTPLSFVVWNGGRYAGQARFVALLLLLILALVRRLPALQPLENTKPSYA